jgi:hypothetical protein
LTLLFLRPLDLRDELDFFLATTPSKQLVRV